MITLLAACAGPTTGGTPPTPAVVSSGPPPHAVWTEGPGGLLGHTIHVSQCGPTGGATVATWDDRPDVVNHPGRRDTYLFDVDSPSGRAPDVARAVLDVPDDAEVTFSTRGFVGDIDRDGVGDFVMSSLDRISLVSADVDSGPAYTAGWGDLTDIGVPVGCAEDYDGDGVLDLMVHPGHLNNGEFVIWLAPDAALVYSPWVRLTTDPFLPTYRIYRANLDGSGGTDLVFSQQGFATVTGLTDHLVIEDLPRQDGNVVAVGDLEGDGLDDLVTWEYESSSLVLLRNGGGGTRWDEMGRIGWDPGGGVEAWVGDVDGDGIGDVVLPQSEVGGSDSHPTQGLVAIFRGVKGRVI